MSNKRTITIELPGDISANSYADLAHGAWTLLKISGLTGAEVISDNRAKIDELNARWDSYGIESPWRKISDGGGSVTS